MINQLLVVGIVTLVASGLLRESYRASAAAELALPTITRWYFAVGPKGLMIAGLASVAISLGVVGLRQRPAAVVLMSLSFVACMAFWAVGFFAAIAPLLVTIRQVLPPEKRW